MKRLLLFVPLSFVLILALVDYRSDAQQSTPPGGTPSALIPGLLVFDDPSPSHTDEAVDYPQNPPAGGPHNPVWQQCGFYDLPVRNENAVHSQEHGAVWITYQPDLPSEQVDQLRELAAQYDYVLVSPYQGLPAPIVASAWGKQLYVDDAGDTRLEQFIELFAGNGPESGAPCTGGTDATVPFATPVSGTPAS
jgi:hypothetical protein